MKDKYKKENLQEVVKSSYSIADVCRALGIGVAGRNFYTVKKYIKEHEISIEHFLSRDEQIRSLSADAKIPLNKVLVVNSSYSRKNLKKRIIKGNLIPYICQKCKNEGSWEGENLSLHLDHINGVNNDNRLENLRFLCPNCHSQTKTYCGKHTSKKAKLSRERAENGGLTNRQIEQSVKSRRVERPQKEVLIEEIKELNFVGTGKKYGVSDNAIRKWCKAYNISTRASDYRK